MNSRSPNKRLLTVLPVIVIFLLCSLNAFAATGKLAMGSSSKFLITFPPVSSAPAVSAVELAASFGFDEMINSGQLREAATLRNPYGAATRFIQYYKGIPVLGGSVIAYINNDGTPRSLSGTIAIWSNDNNPNYTISSTQAVNLAIQYIQPKSLRGELKVQKVVLPHSDTPTLRHLNIPIFCWKIDIPAGTPLGDWEVIIDATHGKVLQVDDRLRFLNGTGLVFDPDPITASGDTSLNDDNDDADAIPEEAYSEVDLYDISQNDDEQYILTGPWIDTAPTEDRACMDEHDFSFDREDDHFEEVMSYYHLDRQARYICSIGFDDLPPSQQLVNVNGVAEDLSFFSPHTGIITTGSGGVDDAEDADVLLHEYGHALMQQIVPDWRGGDTGLLSEGLCDYLAGDRSLEMAPDFQPYQLFNWDGHNEFWEGRILNSDLSYPEAQELDQHDGGQIWSSLLIEVRQVSGQRDLWNQVVIDHLYSLPDSTTVPDAAASLLESDRYIANGSFRQLVINGCEARDIFPTGRFSPRLFHRPLGDTENLHRARRITVSINSQIPLNEDRLWLVYTIDDNEPDTVSLSAVENRRCSYFAYLPLPHEESNIAYYISAFDTSSVFSTHPAGAPFEQHSFYAGPDRAPPVIAEVDSLPDSVFPDGEVTVGVRVTDNIAVEAVSLLWYWGDMEQGGIIPLEPSHWDSTLYTGRLGWALQEPDFIHYIVTAMDGSNAGNTASSRRRTFSIRPEVTIDDFERDTRRWQSSGWFRSEQDCAEGTYCLTDRVENYGYIPPRETVAEIDETWDFSRFDRARLIFWEVHRFDFMANEYGILECRELDGEEWQELERFTGNQDWWWQRIIDLSDYCEGRTAPIRLRFRTVTPEDAEYRSGWQIDELRLQTGNIVKADTIEYNLSNIQLLMPPFPNPSNNSVSFVYNLATTGKLELIDITGRTAICQPIPQGNIRTSLNLANLPSGVYVLRLSSGGIFEEYTIVLLR
ncbi:MAG: T9SS type A sorting domain-containing protein [Candidatus Hatepunaea meridiana]|nr:T9SS type A sorting domain-containing protein [Candidatus Hatepunaea meridiana]